jgi:hypothetical protein
MAAMELGPAIHGGLGCALCEQVLESEEGVECKGERVMELGERPGTLHTHASEGKGMDTRRARGNSSQPWRDEL